MIVLLKKRAAKELSHLPTPERNKVVKKLRLLKIDPYGGKPLLGEYKGYLSLKSWPYRIIYTIEKESIAVYSIAHRQGAYKK